MLKKDLYAMTGELNGKHLLQTILPVINTWTVIGLKNIYTKAVGN